MRSTKETPDFPYALNNICYIETAKDGSVSQIQHSKDGILSAYTKAKSGEVDIYAVWPGKYRSDLFIVDDLDSFAGAYGITTDNAHMHDVEYKISEFDDGKSQFANVDIEFKCGCTLDFNNIKSIANDLKKQFGLEMTTSTGFGCHHDFINGKTVYSIRVRRSSIKK